jgi:hypothetical protein
MNIKSKISTWLLDVTEKLPEFQGGVIGRLQSIRKSQRMFAQTDLELRLKPDNVSINLERINIALPFALEEYALLQSGLKKLFKNSVKIIKLTDQLKDDASSLSKTSWGVIGKICPDEKNNTASPFDFIVDIISEKITRVEVSYVRILPSLVMVDFSCIIDESVSKELETIQHNAYIETVEFTHLWPINKIGKGHSGRFGGGASTAIQEELNKITGEVMKYLTTNFISKKNVTIIEQCSFVNVFTLQGEYDDENRTDWIKKHYQWLNGYGIAPLRAGYAGEDSYYWIAEMQKSKSYRQTVVLALDNFEYLDSLKLYGLSVINTIFTTGDRYKRVLENLHHSGFQYLSLKNITVTKRIRKVQELKIMLATIARFIHELRKNSHSGLYWIDGIGAVKDYRGNDINLSNSIQKNQSNRVEQLKESAEILDSGLSRFIELQNITVMFKLQKRIWFLTILALFIAAIVGWDSISSAVTTIIDWLSNLTQF